MNKTVIAFIDDQPEIVSSLKRIYRNDRKTHQIFTTVNQQELLDFVKNNRVHVVVSDMQMPGMSGSELLKEVRRISPNTIRILLTGFAEKQNILKCINDAQAFRFVTKPWDNENLKTIIALSAHISKELYNFNSVHTILEQDENKSVLFIGNKKEAIYQQIKNQVDHIYSALTPSESVVNLSQNPEINVIVLHEKSYNEKNTHSHYNSFLTLIKYLKKKRPNLISIVTGHCNDADAAINLINEGQIYRLLEEPVSEKVIQNSIDDALKYANLLIEQPELMVQHIVDDIDEAQFEELEKVVDLSMMDKLSQNLSNLVKKLPFLKLFLTH